MDYQLNVAEYKVINLYNSQKIIFIRFSFEKFRFRIHNS